MYVCIYIYVREYVSAAERASPMPYRRPLTARPEIHTCRRPFAYARESQTGQFRPKSRYYNVLARACARSRTPSANRKTNIAMSDCDFRARKRVSHSGIAQISRYDALRRQHSRWTECAARPIRHRSADDQRSIEHNSYHANGRGSSVGIVSVTHCPCHGRNRGTLPVSIHSHSRRDILIVTSSTDGYPYRQDSITFRRNIRSSNDATMLHMSKLSRARARAFVATSVSHVPRYNTAREKHYPGNVAINSSVAAKSRLRERFARGERSRM